MRLHGNIVDVDYHIFIRDKKTQQVEEVRETHRMRYLFYPEVEDIVEKYGFKLLNMVIQKAQVNIQKGHEHFQ